MTETAAQTAARLAELLKPGDLDATLAAITEAAMVLIPDVVGSSITIRHGGELTTFAPTGDVLPAIDALQYELQEGPCYDAATDALNVVSSDLANDRRFPAYGPAAVAAGVRAQAGFRLFQRGDRIGGLNLYSTRVGAFAGLEETGALFRSHAAVALSYAHEVTTLKAAVETRTVIGQAMGVLMERYGLSDDRAFAFLTRLSQERNVKLRVVAEELAAEASARASNGG